MPEIDQINDITLGSLLSGALNLFLVLGGVAVFASLLYAGFLFITSQGTPDKIQTARQSLTYSILGVLVIAFTYVIMIYIKSLI